MSPTALQQQWARSRARRDTPGGIWLWLMTTDREEGTMDDQYWQEAISYAVATYRGPYLRQVLDEIEDRRALAQREHHAECCRITRDAGEEELDREDTRGVQ